MYLLFREELFDDTSSLQVVQSLIAECSLDDDTLYQMVNKNSTTQARAEHYQNLRREALRKTHMSINENKRSKRGVDIKVRSSQTQNLRSTLEVACQLFYELIKHKPRTFINFSLPTTE